jgi:hypothetical protein
MQEFDDSWKAFYGRKFPTGCAGKEIHGIELAMLDSTAAGCIDTFVSNRGKLDNQRLDILRVCETELGIVVHNLTGDARDYFRHLHLLTKEILACIG